MELKVLDINVWHGLWAKSFWRVGKLETPQEKDARTRALIASVKELDPHVITIQESFPQPELAERLARELDCEQVHVVSNAGIRVLGRGIPLAASSGEGSAILAKRGLGLRSRGERALSGFGYASRNAAFHLVPRRMGLAAEVTIEGKRVVIVTAHVRYEFHSKEEVASAWRALAAEKLVPPEVPAPIAARVAENMAGRDRELEALLSWIDELARDGTPVVLGADLNVDDGSPQLTTAPWQKLVNVLHTVGDTRRTWDPATNPHITRSARYDHVDGTAKSIPDLLFAHHDRIAQRPDHIVLGPGFERSQLAHAQVVFEKANPVVPSDHYGIFAVVRV